MGEILAVLASLIHIGTIACYFRQVRDGLSIPNPSTWAIWGTISLINAPSYFRVVENNWFEAGITIVTAIGILLIFTYTLFQGKFGKVKTSETVSFLLALVIGIFWKTTGSAVLANILLQGVYVISFWPTGRGLIKRELQEHPTAWLIAIVAYSVQVLAILAGWKDGVNWAGLVHPMINGILGNGIIVIIIFKMKNSAPSFK